MGRILFFVIGGLVVFVLQISIFGVIPLILAYLLYILFFSGNRETFVLAFLLGFLQDIFSPVFGVFLSTYFFVFLMIALLAHTFITNKSFVAYTLLGCIAFVLFEMCLFVIPFIGSFFTREFYASTFSQHYLITLATSFGWYLVLLACGFFYEAKKRIF